MNNRLKNAFDHICAEEEIKDKTREFLLEKMHKGNKAFGYRRFVPVMVCFLLFMVGVSGSFIYLTPVSAISIDINPSVELGVNRFDKIVSVKGYNDDGKELADSLNVQFMDYTQAMDQILADESVKNYLLQDEMLLITVISENEKQSEKIYADMKSCTFGQKNIHCYSADFEDVEQAHSLGLSYGKYRAFLELQKLNSDITPEEIENMTMKEIRELISSLSNDDTANSQSHNGGGNGFGTGKGNGQKQHGLN